MTKANNQCDGCNAGLPYGQGFAKNIHMSQGRPEMVCCSHLYEELPLPAVRNPCIKDKGRIKDFLNGNTLLCGGNAFEWVLETDKTAEVVIVLLLQRAEYGQTGNKIVDDLIESVYSDLIDIMEGGAL